MSRLKLGVRTVVRTIGGLVCFGLAELCRRATWICPDWVGQMSVEVMLSAIFLMVAIGFFAGGCWLFYITYEDLREGWRHRTEAARIQRNQDHTIQLWLTTKIVGRSTEE